MTDPPPARRPRPVLRRAALASLAIALGGTLALLIDEATPWSPSPRPPADTDGWQLDGLTLEREIPRLTTQFFDGATLWATQYADVYRSDDLGASWRRCGRLGPRAPGPAAALRHRLARSELARRLRTRVGIETLWVLRSGTVLAAAGDTIYRAPAGGGRFAAVHRHPRAPEWKKVLRHWAEDPHGAMWFGEYGVDRLAPSRILRSVDDGASFEPVLELPRGGDPDGVRHVHGVQVDPHGGKVWVVTGDRPEESRIGWLDGDRLVTIGGGARMWTAVSLLFTETHVVWGTDALQHPCGVFRWSRADGVVEQVAELPGPVLYAAPLGDGTLLVATAIEGRGVDGVELWGSPDGARWRRLATLPPFGDPGDRRLGSLLFPLGAPAPRPVFTVDRLGAVRRATYVGSLDEGATRAPSAPASAGASRRSSGDRSE